MLDQLFDKLPYEQLEKIKFVHLLAGAVGTGVLFIVIYFFTIYSSGQEEFVALVVKKEQVEKKLKENELLVARTSAVEKELATRGHALAQVKRQMPLANDMPQLLRKVGDSEGELALQIMAFEVEEGKVNDYYKEIPIKIQVRGGYWNAVGFFDKLQDLLQIVNFSDLKMETRKEKKSAARGKGNLEAKQALDSMSTEKVGLITEVKAKAFAYIDGAEDRAAASAAPPPPAAAPKPPPAKE
jgi:type IV pilus assembly protein PilO